MSAFGDRSRELRLKHRLNQTDFGEKVGVSQQVVHKWEAGRTSPGPETVACVAKVYGVTADYLLGLVEIPNIYRHTVSFPDGREGYLLEEAGFVKFLRSNPSLSPSEYPEEYKPLVLFVKSVLLESFRGGK